MKLVIDIETRNDRDLRAVGSWKYSRSPVGGINCIAIKSGSRKKVYDYYDCLTPNTQGMLQLKSWIDLPDTHLVAHNATFEADYLLNCYGWDIPAHKWRCTQAKVAYYNLPQSLDGAAQTLKLPLLKDINHGKKAMLATCMCDVRGKHVTPKDLPETFEQLYSYCMTDVEVTELLDQKLPDIPESEQTVWEMHFDINRHGIPMDWFLVNNAVELIERLHENYDAFITKFTDGKLKSVRQTEALTKWVRDQGLTNVADIAKGTVENLLYRKDLPAHVRTVLEYRQEQSAASIAKFKKMLARMDDVDNRLRGEFWYYGARTGRWTGVGVQTQNLVRGFDEMLCDGLTHSNISFIEAFYDKPMAALKNGVRGAMQAEDEHIFLGVDSSQIEARCTCWIPGHEKGLQVYRDGRDPYCESASNLFGTVVTKEDKPKRLAGKVQVLALGFGGGISSLERNSNTHGLDLSILLDLIKPTYDEEVKAEYGMKWYYDQQGGTLPQELALVMDVVKQRWRVENKIIVDYWDELFDAFCSGMKRQVGLIGIDCTAAGTRVLTLPSGRQLFYRNVKVRQGNVTYDTREGTVGLIKGKLFENAVQAVDADIARFYMLLAKELSPIVHHSHDEYLLHVLLKNFEEVQAKIKHIHSTMFPSWTTGLPIGFEMWSGFRYEK